MTVFKTGHDVARSNARESLLSAHAEGGLVKIRHGAYAIHRGGDPELRHRQLIAGTWPLLGSGTVLSHGSAALLHGLPTWPAQLEQVSAIHTLAGHGKRTPYLHLQQIRLSDREIVELEGVRVTSLERTAVDSARELDFRRAVAVMDAALRRGADRGVLVEILAVSRRRKGVGVARRAAGFADARAESVWESISRVAIAELGLPMPELQFDVFLNGVWVARTDFAWPEFGVVGEFDGAIKYSGGPAEAREAVMAEKRRQNLIEEAGWRVVRWDARDLHNPGQFRNRIASAFDSRGRALAS